jgi:hypothetical protein
MVLATLQASMLCSSHSDCVQSHVRTWALQIGSNHKLSHDVMVSQLLGFVACGSDNNAALCTGVRLGQSQGTGVFYGSELGLAVALAVVVSAWCNGAGCWAPLGLVLVSYTALSALHVNVGSHVLSVEVAKLLNQPGGQLTADLPEEWAWLHACSAICYCYIFCWQWVFELVWAHLLQ